MYEAECNQCGAIFTLDAPQVPECVECVCQGKEFKIANLA